MATISLEHSRRQRFIHTPTWGWVPSVPHPLFQGLGRLAQQCAGLAMLLFGSAMLFTLWLIPIGLPLAMLGVAIMSEPRN